jgi:hypothetical protein
MTWCGCSVSELMRIPKSEAAEYETNKLEVDVVCCDPDALNVHGRLGTI